MSRTDQAPKKPTTKEELKQLIALWPTHNIAQVAEKLDRRYSWVTGMSKRLRLAGVNLPKKPSMAKAYLNSMIAEVASENR